jgi:hypothetical protein
MDLIAGLWDRQRGYDFLVDRLHCLLSCGHIETGLRFIDLRFAVNENAQNSLIQ